MADSVEVFLIGYQDFDLLLPAGDYEGLLSADDCLAAGTGLGSLALEQGCLPAVQIRQRDASFALVSLESYAARLGSADRADQAGCRTIFMVDTSLRPDLLLLVERDFELHNYRYADLRLIPACLRRWLEAVGIVGMAFSGTGKLQLIVCPVQLPELLLSWRGSKSEVLV